MAHTNDRNSLSIIKTLFVNVRLLQHLKTIMDSAENGVIYFSMGGTMKAEHFSDHIIQNFLTAFEGLNQTIIWKFDKVPSNLPRNILHVESWLPQQSILGEYKILSLWYLHLHEWSEMIMLRDISP